MAKVLNFATARAHRSDDYLGFRCKNRHRTDPRPVVAWREFPDWRDRWLAGEYGKDHAEKQHARAEYRQDGDKPSTADQVSNNTGRKAGRQ